MSLPFSLLSHPFASLTRASDPEPPFWLEVSVRARAGCWESEGEGQISSVAREKPSEDTRLRSELFRPPWARRAAAWAWASGSLEDGGVQQYHRGMSSRRQFRAVYEGGVLRPLEKLDMSEGDVVDLLLPPSSWEEDLEDLLRQRALATAEFTADEVDRDVAEAIAQIRRGQRESA
jgi:predicted DNA-binding antitoxin AbrB/MazE fold protein